MKKKFGYTLAEVLIALTIIGILAAVSLPLVNKYSPDTAKVKYLKTYDTIREVVPIIVDSKSFYPIEDQVPFVQRNPLFNIAEVTVEGSNYGGDARKFCQVFGAFLSDTVRNCEDEFIPLDLYRDDSNFTNDTRNFRARNGVDFFVSSVCELERRAYQSNIYFDVNGVDKEPNCIYNEDTCTKPDRFLLMVSANGNMRVGDKVGQYYLDNRINYKSREIDLSLYEDFDPMMYDLDDYACRAALPDFKTKTCLKITNSGVQFEDPDFKAPRVLKVFGTYTDSSGVKHENAYFEISQNSKDSNIVKYEEIVTTLNGSDELKFEFDRIEPNVDRDNRYVLDN